MYQRASPVRLLGNLRQGLHCVFRPVAVARYLQMALPDTWHTRHTRDTPGNSAGTDAATMTAVENSSWRIFQFPKFITCTTYAWPLCRSGIGVAAMAQIVFISRSIESLHDLHRCCKTISCAACFTFGAKGSEF